MIDQSAANLSLRNRMLSLVAARTTAFARNSTATYTDVNGIVQTAGVNVLRNAHYVGGVLQPPLIEGAATNLALHSDDFSNAYWSVGQSGVGSTPVVTPDFGLAPDGVSTADRVQFALNGGITTAAISFLQRAIALDAQTYSKGVWLKSNTGASYVMNWRLGSNSQLITVTPTWQRFVLSNTTSPDNTNWIALRGGLNPVCSDTADILIWGWQFELAAASTSTIVPMTVAATVTRAADIDQMFAATATGYSRQIGSFLTEGFADGMEFVPAVFTDNTPRVIESVSALNLVTTTSPTPETAVAGRSLTVGVPQGRAFENRRSYKPIPGRPYIDEDFVPGTHSLLTASAQNGMVTEDGLYVVRLFGLEGKGEAGIRKWVDALRALFTPGTNLVAGSNTVRVRTDVSVRSGPIIPQGNGWAVCTVTIPWWALTNNLVAA